MFIFSEKCVLCLVFYGFIGFLFCVSSVFLGFLSVLFCVFGVKDRVFCIF